MSLFCKHEWILDGTKTYHPDRGFYGLTVTPLKCKICGKTTIGTQDGKRF